MARTHGALSTHTAARKQQQLWQAMRVMRRFTTLDLLTTCEGVSIDLVWRFVRPLHWAGYLYLEQPRVSGRPGSRDLWALVRDSGPLAPIVYRYERGVADQNTGERWVPETAAAEAA